MLLRSIELIWKPKKIIEPIPIECCSDYEMFQQYLGKGFWNECKLSIHWTYDSDSLTKQGSEKVRQRKLDPQLKKFEEKQKKLEKKQDLLSRLEQEVPELSRTEDQTKRIESMRAQIQTIQEDLSKPRPKLDCLQGTKLFNRPDRPLYEGVSNIFVGVFLDLDKHLVVTVVDAMQRKVLAIRNARSVSKRQFKSEVHHLEGCPGGTHRDSLMFTTTKDTPYELLSAYRF